MAIVDYELALQDEDGNEYSMNGENVDFIVSISMYITNERIDREVKTKENSYLDGSQLISEQRINSRDLTIEYEIAQQDQLVFVQFQNEITAFLDKAVYLINKTHGKRLRVECTGINARSGEGEFHQHANVTIDFNVLNPFWEDVEETTETKQSSTDLEVQFTINNDGYRETPAIFELVADQICNKFSIINETTNQGVIIEDIGFGAENFNNYLVDNESGQVLLEDLLRNRLIKEGTGFFNLQIGSNVITIESAVAITATYRFRKRYYYG